MEILLLVLVGWLAMSAVAAVLVAALCRGGHLSEDQSVRPSRVR